MAGAAVERAVEVFGNVYGSGTRIGGRLVLTARHVLTGADASQHPVEITVRTVDGKVAAAELVWDDEESDLALLTAGEEITPTSPVVIGELPRSPRAMLEFELFGWPEAGATSIDDSPIRDPVHGYGQIDLAEFAGAQSGRIRLRMADLLQAKEGVSLWSGLSGAGVFCGELLVGVQTSQPSGWVPEFLHAEPIARTNIRDRISERLELDVAAHVVVHPAGDEWASWLSVWPPPLVSQADPFVHLGLRDSDTGGVVDPTTGLPPYIGDPAVDSLIDHAFSESGGFVVVVGYPMVGKTRTAFEGLARKHPRRRLLIPHTIDDLGSVCGHLSRLSYAGMDLVLWLDDLHDYLIAGQLRPNDVRVLTGAGVLVIGTTWQNHYDAFHRRNTLPDMAGGSDLSNLRAGADVLALATVIRMPRSATQSQVAAAQASFVESTEGFREEISIAETLCAVPLITSRWAAIREEPSGAVVAAGIDLVRCGLGPDIDLAQLVDLYPRYRKVQDPFVPADAKSVAEECRGLVQQLCAEVIDGTRQRLLLNREAQSLRVYERLVAEEDRPVLDETWDYCLKNAPDRELEIGVSAAIRERPDVAEQAWRRCSLKQGSSATRAVFNLGLLLKDQRRFTEAAAAYQDVIATEDLGISAMAGLALAILLEEQERFPEAEAAYRDVIATDHIDIAPRATLKLAILLSALERHDEAREGYRQAIMSAHPEWAPVAALFFGRTLEAQDRLNLAEEAFRLALLVDHPEATALSHLSLGILLDRQERTDEAEAAYRDAIAAGHDNVTPQAAWKLGYLLDIQDRTSDAEAAFRTAVATNDPKWAPNAAFFLGRRLESKGRSADAAELFRTAIAFDLPDIRPLAALGLGALMEEKGQTDEAVDAYRVAVTDGPPEVVTGAAAAIAKLLSAEGRCEEAAEAWRIVIDIGHAGTALAGVNLAILLEGQGKLTEAVDAYRAAVRSNESDWSPRAADRLGRLLYLEGELEDAEQAYRTAIESDHPVATPLANQGLGHLLAHVGRSDDAEQAYRAAIASNDDEAAPYAAVQLGELLRAAGRRDEAERVFLAAISFGHLEVTPQASVMLGLLLADEQRFADAERRFRSALEYDDPDWCPAASYSLGVLLAATDREDEAADALQSAATSKHGEWAPAAARALEELRGQ